MPSKCQRCQNYNNSDLNKAFESSDVHPVMQPLRPLHLRKYKQPLLAESRAGANDKFILLPEPADPPALQVSSAAVKACSKFRPLD
jgi:hypothetical protein